MSTYLEHEAVHVGKMSEKQEVHGTGLEVPVHRIWEARKDTGKLIAGYGSEIILHCANRGLLSVYLCCHFWRVSNAIVGNRQTCLRASNHRPRLVEALIPTATSASSLLLSLGLLLEIYLYASLARLAFIMLVSVLCLALTVTRKTSNSTTEGTSDAITNTLAKIVQLSFRLLLLACAVLLTSLLLESLAANQIPEGFLAGSDGLVPGALSTVGVVFSWDTGGGDCEARPFNTGVGEVLLGFGLGLALVCVGLGGRQCGELDRKEWAKAYLIASAPSYGGNSLLDCTSGGVDVRLEGGRILRHVG